MLEDGSILRGLLPGRPTADSLFSDVLCDGKSLLKVRSPHSMRLCCTLACVAGSSMCHNVCTGLTPARTLCLLLAKLPELLA